MSVKTKEAFYKHLGEAIYSLQMELKNYQEVMEEIEMESDRRSVADEVIYNEYDASCKGISALIAKLEVLDF